MLPVYPLCILKSPSYFAAWIPIAAEPISYQNRTTLAPWDVMLASTTFSPFLVSFLGEGMVIIPGDFVSY